MKEKAEKRKHAERIANYYYKEWRAERTENKKQLKHKYIKALEYSQIQFFIPTDLLYPQYDVNGKERVLGSGVFGTVTLNKYKDNLVAVKCFDQSEKKKKVIHEAKILLSLKFTKVYQQSWVCVLIKCRIKL